MGFEVRLNAKATGASLFGTRVLFLVVANVMVLEAEEGRQATRRSSAGLIESAAFDWTKVSAQAAVLGLVFQRESDCLELGAVDEIVFKN